MSRTRLLILLLSLVSLSACGYTFVLDGNRSAGAVHYTLAPSANTTALREAALILDGALEERLSGLNLLGDADGQPRITCTITGTSVQEITSVSLGSEDRYRLNLTVLARVDDSAGKEFWRHSFTDEGTFTDRGQEEDALEEASLAVADRIARRLLTLQP